MSTYEVHVLFEPFEAFLHSWMTMLAALGGACPVPGTTYSFQTTPAMIPVALGGNQSSEK